MAAAFAGDLAAMKQWMALGRWRPTALGPSGESILRTLAHLTQSITQTVEQYRAALEWLIAAGAPLNVKMPRLHNNTPAHLAAQRGNWIALEVFSLCGADFDQPNRFRETARSWIEEHSQWGPPGCCDWASQAISVRERRILNDEIAAREPISGQPTDLFDPAQETPPVSKRRL